MGTPGYKSKPYPSNSIQEARGIFATGQQQESKGQIDNARNNFDLAISILINCKEDEAAKLLEEVRTARSNLG